MNIIFIPIFVAFLDQASKIYIKNYWLDNNLLFYSKINIIGDFVRFVFVENPGIAFGIDTSKFHLVIIILTVFAVVSLTLYLYKLIKENNPDKYAISFILGGAIGNLIDRFFVLFPTLNYKGVIDFIDIGYKNFRWYTFNIADASITIGLILYIYQMYLVKGK